MSRSPSAGARSRGYSDPAAAGEVDTSSRHSRRADLCQRHSERIGPCPHGSPNLRRRIGYATQNPAIYADLTVY